MAAGPPGPSPRSPRPSPRPSLPPALPPLPLGHPKSRNHRPRVRQWTCRYKDLQRPIRRESAVVRRSRRGAESRLDLRREVLVPLREGLLLLLEGLHPNREGLLVLLELFLQRLAIVLPDEQHPDALVHRRIVLDLGQFFQSPFDFPQLGLELHALAAEDLELVLQLLVLGDLVLKLRGNVLHAFTSWRTRAATSAQRRYEFTAARSAPVSSASIVRVRRPGAERIATRAFGTSRPVSGRNASYTTPASGPESPIVARRMVIAPCRPSSRSAAILRTSSTRSA